ncbi:hypothetical protein LWI28_026267 [Acer negundo]|uniref:Uncharacterized protein n=1 Tax=Acer negundo TaxID=4023 RepID=A0AAD5ISE7_ACENE|nr:hypothetical protein LWI28_026267 [Acer negundo]
MVTNDTFSIAEKAEGGQWPTQKEESNKSTSKGSGSRFDELGEKDTNMMSEDEQFVVTKARGKAVLLEITNYPGKQRDRSNSTPS